MLLPLSGLLAGIKPRVKLLALAIPYSWIPNEQLGNYFFLGPFNINKWILVGTSKGDYRVKAPPQACQQNVFVILTVLKSTHGVNSCGPFHMNKRPGLPVYIDRRNRLSAQHER